MSDGQVVIDSTIDSDGIEKGIKSIRAKLSKLSGAFGKVSKAAKGITLGGGIFAGVSGLTAGVAGLTGAFAAAGAGVIGFAAVAIPNLNDVFEASSKITDAQEALTKATTNEERQKALEDMQKAMMGLSDAQKQAVRSLQDFKGFWDKFTKSFQKPVLNAFSKGLKTMKLLLKGFEPAIQGSTKAVNDLLTKLNNALQSSEAKAFFEFLGKNAGPMLEKFGTLAINMMKAVMKFISVLGPAMKTAMNFLSDIFGLVSGIFEGDKSAVDGFIQKLSKSIPQLIQMGAQIITSLLKGLIDNMPLIVQSASQLLGTLIDSFINRLPLLVTLGIKLILNLIKGFIQMLPTLMVQFMGLIQTIGKIITQNLPMIITMGMQLLMALIQGIIKFLPNIITTVFKVINKIINVILKNLPLIIQMGIQVLNALIDGIIQNLPAIIKATIHFLTVMLNAIIKHLPQIIDAGIKLLNALIDGLLEVLPLLIKASLKLLFAITDALINHIDEIVAAGVKLIGALIKGLIRALPDIWHMIRKQLIPGLLKELGKIDLLQIGKNIIKGLIKGFTSLNIPTPHFSVTGGIDLNPAGGFHLPSVDIDWRAQGGLFAANSPRLIGIGDNSMYQEAALPLSPSVLGMIGQKIADTMPGSKQGGTYVFHNTFEIDGEKVSEKTVEYDSIALEQMQIDKARGG